MTALDWDWIRQDDGVELRVQTRGETDGEMGFTILDPDHPDDGIWGLSVEAVEWLRDRLSEWLARQGGH
jgi:hypothetical protein